ncbi:MAG: nuclear transport factor 2 family protein [Pyrinomonadaceae bacterium]
MMMNKFVGLIVFVLLLTSASWEQSSSDAAELTRLLNEFLAGASRNDADVHDRFWAEDLIYTRSSGARTNKAELMKGVRSTPAQKEGDPVTVYSAEDVQIQQYGNAAVVAFKLVGNTTTADGKKSTSNFFNTGTFIKRKGKWQAVAWQATIIPPPQSTNQAQTVQAPVKPSTPGATTRTYVKGQRGGCYYLNSNGAKVYVDKKYCP